MATQKNPFDIKTGNTTDVNLPPPGILGAQMQQVTAADTTGAVAKAAPTQWNPTDWNVDKNQTVQGQLEGILAKGSPLLEKARADTMQAANSRGLLNSTMAAGAGTGAVLDRALQIAQPDANTYASAGQFNATGRNQSASDFATASNTMSLANADAANKAAESTAGRQLQAGVANQQTTAEAAKTEYAAAVNGAMQNADAANKQSLAVLDGQIRNQLAGIEAEYKTQMQTSQSAAAIYSEALKAVAQIMTDKDLDAGAKQNLINQQMAAVANGLRFQQQLGQIPGLDEIIASIGAPGTLPPTTESPKTNTPPASDPNNPLGGIG